MGSEQLVPPAEWLLLCITGQYNLLYVLLKT